MKKCFTINPHRTTEEFKSYYPLINNDVFQAVEIFYPYMLDLEAIKTYYNNAKEFINLGAEMVLHLPHGLKNDLCNLEDYPIIIKRMKEAIDFGKKLNVCKYTIHLGYVKDNKRLDLITHIVPILKELCIYASSAVIMIENMPGNNELGYSPSEILEIIQKVNQDNIKFIYDTGHGHVSEFDHEEYFKELLPYLYHIHISDNKGLKDEHGRIGSGNIDFKSIFKILGKYSELYCLEILYSNEQDLIQYSKDLDSLV